MAFVFKSPSPPQRIAILCKIFVPYHLLNLHHYIHHHPSITNWFPMFVLLNQRGFKITSNRHSSGHIGTWNLLRRAEKIYTNTSMVQNWVPPIRFFQRIISLPPILTRARLCPAVASHLIPSAHPRFPGWEAVDTCWWIPASLSPTSMLRAWPVMRFMSSSHLLCTICIIKGSWEAILPCYGQKKLWDLTLSIGVAASRLQQWFVSRFSHFWR